MKHEFSFRDPTKKPRAEKLKEILEGSQMIVSVTKFRTLHIILKGKLARIPSMKNSKLPGKNFAHPDFITKVRALDQWWAHSKQSWSSATMIDKFHVLLICGDRPTQFDPIGCLETIQDWLEPASKKVGKKGARRGWGIGIVDNDSQITGFAVKASDVLMPMLDTHIIIQPLSEAMAGISKMIDTITKPMQHKLPALTVIDGGAND